MQRPVFITVQAPINLKMAAGSFSSVGPQTVETPYLVSIHPGRGARTNYMPVTEHQRDCRVCSKRVPRTEFVYATRHWDGFGVRCKACTPAVNETAPHSGRRPLLGWVHDSVGAAGYVSAQVGGVVEDDSNASVLIN